MKTMTSRWWLPAAIAGSLLAAPAPAQPATTASPPTAINGVYTGTYQRSDGNKKLKFSIKSTDDGILTGLFTFELPAQIGSSVTYKLTGRYVAGAHDYGLKSSPFQFTTVEPMGSLALDAFDASKVKAVHVGITGSGSIVGSLTGSDPVSGQFNCGWLNATRDKTQPASLDDVMAAQLRAASGVGAAAPGAGTAPVARLTSINGVYNGTFPGDQGPTKFKLTLTQLGGGTLGGVFTVYLTNNSGTQGYTYSLQGQYANRHFQLDPRTWDTVPPANFPMVVLNGTFVPNVTENTARVSGTMMGSKFIKFEADWDSAESVHIDKVIAEQKAAGPPAVPPPSAAVLAAHAAALKNAPPAQLASKGLVRKSQAYWDDYRTDLIRQVFDGGFGSDVDKDQQFRILFATYVEMFSKKDRACLPAQHETVTVTQYTIRKDDYGNVISKEAGATITVEVDSRFARYYRAYGEASQDSGQGLVNAVGIMSGSTSPSAFLDPAIDIERFFNTETGSSAAMHQLGENLLRGATGDPSLQDAGATIPGAEAETDKSLPPGRFLHFVDAANAFYRDPANARYRTGHETAFCNCLAEKYKNLMTSEEEYYYANDFGARFQNQIMQPQKNCTDPAWARLHPAVDECISATQ